MEIIAGEEFFLEKEWESEYLSLIDKFYDHFKLITDALANLKIQNVLTQKDGPQGPDHQLQFDIHQFYLSEKWLLRLRRL